MALLAVAAAHAGLLWAWHPGRLPLPPTPAQRSAQLLWVMTAPPAAPTAPPRTDAAADRPTPPAPAEAPQGPPDRPALAVAGLDLSPLQGLPLTGLPLRLRLQVDATGTVTAVDVLECADEDRPFAEALAALLRRTPHIPARRQGRDVASVKDIELNFGTSSAVRTWPAPPAGG